MKQSNYLLLLVVLVFFTHCKKNHSEDKQSDEDFIKFLNDKTYTKSIKRIDSIAKANIYSDHKTGLLYYEKGNILGHLEKDVEAIGSFKKALASFEKEGDKKFIAQTNMYLGNSEAFISNNEKASEYITEPLWT